MTVQFPQIDITEPRLLPDSSKQNSSDLSFEEKLKFEQARLGLLFSPFSQLESLFASAFQAGNWESLQPRTDNGTTSTLDQTKPAENMNYVQNKLPSSFTPLPTAQMFESVPMQSISRQFLQELLTQTGWLVPNLQAQPLFAQAFSEGKLQPKFDLQALVDRIAEQVKLVKGKDQTQFSLSLKPQDLGDILLVLTAQAGAINIQITASQETKKLLDAQRAELERALKKALVPLAGLKIEEVKEHD